MLAMPKRLPPDDLFNPEAGYAEGVKNQQPRAIDVTPPPVPFKRIAFFDTAMNCGLAVLQPDGSIMSTCWQLHKGHSHDSPGMRVLRFRNLLTELHSEYPLEMLAFEKVNRHLGTEAAHSYGGLTWSLMAFAEEHKIAYTSVSVQAIKKEATGRGAGKGTDKPAMCKAAKQRWPHIFSMPVDQINDNIADACFGLIVAAREVGIRVP